MHYFLFHNSEDRDFLFFPQINIANRIQILFTSSHHSSIIMTEDTLSFQLLTIWLALHNKVYLLIEMKCVLSSANQNNIVYACFNICFSLFISQYEHIISLAPFGHHIPSGFQSNFKGIRYFDTMH